MYKISVIVPIFNVQGTIERALDSVLSQTMSLSDIQVILVDDASTDGSGKIIEKYCSKYDNFLSIFLKDNSGAAGIPRNEGIKSSDSEFIMFLDPDDEFSPDYCEVMYDAISKSDADMVKCNFINITDTIKSYNKYFPSDVSVKTIKRSDKVFGYFPIWNGIHRRSFLAKNDILFSDGVGEDILFTVRELIHMDEMIFLNDYFGYIYYNEIESHAKTPTSENIKAILDILVISRELCQKHGRDDIIKIFGRQIQGLLSRVSKNTESVSTRINLLKQIRDFEKDCPPLTLPSVSFRPANFLLLKRLYLLSLISLKVAPKIYHSKILFKILNRSH